MKITDEFNAMLDFARKGNVYIYGTGGNAGILWCVLKANNINVAGYTYSPGYAAQFGSKNSPKSVCVTELSSDMNVIIGTNAAYHKAVYEQLRENNIEAVFPSPSAAPGYHDNMFEGVVTQYCNILSEAFKVEKDAFLTSEFLTLDGVKLPNFCIDKSMKAIEKNTFVIEVGDLLLPYEGGPHFSREGPYERENCAFREGDVVFDLGAAYGVVSALAAAKGCKVYSFEPSCSTLPFLEKTKSLYINNIGIINKAVGNVDGVIKFIDTGAYGGNRVAVNGESVQNGIIEVESVTLDAFVEENNISRVDFIKADIEGSERDMLKGARNVLREHSPKLSLCTYHYPEDKEVMKKLILEANPDYVIEHSQCKLFAYVPEQ